MENEKQRERLVELIKNADTDENLQSYDLYDLVHDTGCAEYLADYLLANNVVVLPENVTIYIDPPIKEVKGKTITIPKWEYKE